MTFASFSFLLLFLPAAVLTDLCVRKTERKNLALALFSVVFYALGEPVYVLVLLACTAFHGVLGAALEKRRSRLLLAAGVCFQAALLCVLKYSPLPMPVGISFWSFQILSYDVDVYRGTAPAERDPVRLVLYVAFFPQLIAGPIVKYRDFRVQFERRTPDAADRVKGFRRFLTGLARKVVLADVCGAVADAAFGTETPGTAFAWIGALAYCLQIYHDFAGYSDMACGLGAMFGFTLPENFCCPYASGTIREFWRRWHMTLSAWFRDYVYLPLGGSRGGKLRTVRNLLIVFLCTGIWHGADVTFVLWGLWHGAFRVLEEFVRPERNRILRILWRPVTLLAILFGFVLFRAESLPAAAEFFRSMLSAAPSAPAIASVLTAWNLSVLLLALVLSFPLIPEAWRRKLPVPADALVCASLVILCAVRLVSSSYHPFI